MSDSKALDLVATIVAWAENGFGTTQSNRRTAADLLRTFGGLRGLSRTTTGELMPALARSGGKKPGGTARAIVAAFELGRRGSRPRRGAPRRFENNEDVFRWAKSRLAFLEHEELWVLALDGRARIRGMRCVARGGLHGVGSRPADVLRAALRLGASAFILVHNHPSGDPTPSPEDVSFTDSVAGAALVVGVPLLDHVVVSSDAFASVSSDVAEGRA